MDWIVLVLTRCHSSDRLQRPRHKNSKAHDLTFEIDAQELPLGVDLHHALASAIDRLFDGRLSRDHYALSVLLASPPYAMAAAASMLGLRLDAGGMAGAGAQQQQRGVAGSKVEACDEAGLCVRPLHRFFRGEVVAWRDGEGVLRYASVVDDGCTRGDGDASAVGEADEEDEGDVSVKRLVIKTGEKSTATVLSSSVYCFRSSAGRLDVDGDEKRREQQADGGAQVTGRAMGGDDVKPSWWDAAINGATSTAGGGGGGGGGEGTGGGRVENEPGPVSARELAGAVSDLLSRLNVPMSLDKAEMMEKLVSSQRELKLAEAKLSSMTKNAAAMEKRGSRMRELCTCPITHELMHDPVTASDGHVYERVAIQRCIQSGAPSPLTRQELSPTLLPSHAHKALCRLVADLG